VKIIFFCLFLSINFCFAEEKLLDKISAVINSRVISLSEINRVLETIGARQEISPMIYTKSSYNKEDITNILIRTTIIRDKISSQGYVISDDAVESRIKMTEDRLGLRRSDLLNFLNSKRITFEEYFEIIRETMEYNIFSTKIIAPLVSVTEQEVKNEYYRKFTGSKALSFTYDLVDFFISTDRLVDASEEKFLNAIKDYQITGKIPQEYESFETNKLTNLSEDTVSKDLSEILKKSTEGSFSKPLILNNLLHVFYIQKKDLVESQDFLKNKERLQFEILTQKSYQVTENWFDRESTNYYIKSFK